MPRNQIIVKFPTLNDKGGDLSKKWYVEYFYRIPPDPTPRKRRISKGLCTGTAEERYRAADEIIRKITAVLKSPELLKMRPDEITNVLRDDEHTRPEADRYLAYEKAIQADNLVGSYIQYLQGSIAQKTYETYKSKLHIYADWCKTTDVHITGCTRAELLVFFQHLANVRKLTKRSIFKYKQILHSFYNWLQEQQYVVENPVRDIPNYGTIVDNAPAPIEKEERSRLKEYIQKRDKQLWLACLIQYYCAIRPNEMRMLKVGDVHKESVTIRQASAKNRHKETVELPIQVRQMIEKLGYLNFPQEYYLFGRYGVPSVEPMGKNTMRNRFNTYRDDLGISKQIKFYSWKHTGAINMVENGISVWDLQHHMRHSSVTTTEEYIRQRANHSKRAKDYLDEI